MRNLILYSLFLFSFILSGAQAATLESYDFSGPVSEQRFKSLIEELRCLVCQNESLAGSDAELANDLRQEVYQMMDAGKSDEQIVSFLVARYGDFVLYDPPLRPSTYLLWFGPFVLLLIAAVLLFYSVSKRSRRQEIDLSEEQQAQVAQLLGKSTTSEDHRQ